MIDALVSHFLLPFKLALAFGKAAVVGLAKAGLALPKFLLVGLKLLILPVKVLVALVPGGPLVILAGLLLAAVVSNATLPRGGLRPPSGSPPAARRPAAVPA